MFLTSMTEGLDQLTGIQGTLGYVVIILVVLILRELFWHGSKEAAMPHTSAVHQPRALKEDEESDPPRNFTLEQLRKFNGVVDEKGNETPLYLSVQGTVFDVSDAKDFYGPGGPYECFAGRECGVALAKMSFDDTYLDDFDGIEKLNHGERMELENWIDKFTHYRRYPILGKLVPPDKLPDSDRVLTLDELAQHDGTSNDIPDGFATPPIYLGAGTKVYDVSFGGVEFYGPGGGYHRFAGKNASRALAKMSFDPEDTNNTSVADLTDDQRKVLADWVRTFEERKKYPVVGRLKLN